MAINQTTAGTFVLTAELLLNELKNIEQFGNGGSENARAFCSFAAQWDSMGLDKAQGQCLPTDKDRDPCWETLVDRMASLASNMHEELSYF
ncbi:hypothetical protein S40293_11247 [Stachybotrys chartarum IBT 40293]|nr:hypothetical protein S40293_11247 [Stachybotrys chartarum IBT 40293]KFA80256.1 hypothetical protein S40288_04569 [Stachybotrys chartarum IBT 40288]